MNAPYLSGTGGLMIDLPHRGNMLAARCRGCGHEVRFTGREIVTRFTKWLPAPVADWAATLRCGECHSRWIMVHATADGTAQGFFQATTETGQVVWCRRLNTYLAEVGTDLWAYLDVLSDMPTPVELEKAGIGPLNSRCTPPHAPRHPPVSVYPADDGRRGSE